LDASTLDTICMTYDYSKRDYLLPEGCKDLIDVMKFEAEKMAVEQQEPANPPVPLPALGGEIVVPKQATVAQLASILQRKPYQIIATLMQMGVFANVHQELDFDTLAKVIRNYGYTARKGF
jgi:hypothetical protein